MDRRLAALAALGLLLAVACGTVVQVAEKLTDTKTLVADAQQGIESATSYHMVISYQQGTQIDVKADLHIKLPADVVGTVSENGNTVNVLETGGAMYVQSKDFVSEYGGSYAGTLVGERWVLVTSDLLRTTVLDMTKLTALPSYFLNLEVGDKRVDHVAAATESTAELESTWGNLYISELAPHRLVKMEAANGFVATDGFTNVTFELLEYGDPVDVQKPADVADLTNPATLPPEYELDGTPSVPPCSYSSCKMTGKVVNKGGAYAPLAPSTFTFTVYTSPAQRPIDHCTGKIATHPHGATATISCTIASAAWRAYTGSSFYWDVIVDNPSYDG